MNHQFHTVPSISRRKLLGGLAFGGGAGSLFSDEIDMATFGRIRDCPHPDDETKLPYRARLADGLLIEGVPEQNRLMLITSDRELSALRTERVSESIQSFIDNIDFENSFLLAVQVGESTETKGLHFTGLERRDDAVYSYSCVTHPYSLWFLPIDSAIEAGSKLVTFLARVQADFQPAFVRHTHRTRGVTVIESE